MSAFQYFKLLQRALKSMRWTEFLLCGFPQCTNHESIDEDFIVYIFFSIIFSSLLLTTHLNQWFDIPLSCLQYFFTT